MDHLRGTPDQLALENGIMLHLWGTPTDSEAAATPLWRYFPTSKLLQVLETDTLYFAAATQFEDRYEGSTSVLSSDLAGFPVGTPAAAFDAFFGNTRNRYKVSCWHQSSTENSLMWQAYATAGKGAAIRSTLDRVIRAIKPLRFGQGPLNDVFWCGSVRYLDLTQEKVPPNAEPPVGIVKRFFFKHNAFEPEREFRFLANLHHFTGAISDPAPPLLGISVSVDLAVLVEAIVVGPGLSQDDVATLEKVAAAVGLADRLRESSLRLQPRFL